MPVQRFFNLRPSEEIHALLDTFGPAATESVPLDEAAGRVLCEDVFAPEDLPSFTRSTVDGYAVRARDTFGASEGLPALLAIRGCIRAGECPSQGLGQGDAIPICTGAMLPDGADAVVMVEHCHILDDTSVEVARSLSPLENVVQVGDDYRQGQGVLRRGIRMRAQDLGALAGLGVVDLPCFKRPTVGIISTGDEVVPIAAPQGPGKTRDVNRYTLFGFCRLAGAVPLFLGLCPDAHGPLLELVCLGLQHADTVWVSGGSSVGDRDLTLRVFEEVKGFTLLAHGISISPGKPTVIGKVGRKPLLGLPGHVASAMVVAEVFLTRLLRRLAGENVETPRPGRTVEAVLTRNVPSATGREDYVRVRLTEGGRGWVAEPLFGKSALLSPLVEADGLFRIDRNTEGLYEGDRVSVALF